MSFNLTTYNIHFATHADVVHDVSDTFFQTVLPQLSDVDLFFKKQQQQKTVSRSICGLLVVVVVVVVFVCLFVCCL